MWEDSSAELAEAHWDGMMEKNTKHGDQNIYIHSKTNMCEDAKTQLSVKTQTKFLCSEAGNAISELCASQKTKKCVLHQVKRAVNGKEIGTLCCALSEIHHVSEYPLLYQMSENSDKNKLAQRQQYVETKTH